MVLLEWECLDMNIVNIGFAHKCYLCGCKLLKFF